VFSVFLFVSNVCSDLAEGFLTNCSFTRCSSSTGGVVLTNNATVIGCVFTDWSVNSGPTLSTTQVLC